MTLEAHGESVAPAQAGPGSAAGALAAAGVLGLEQRTEASALGPVRATHCCHLRSMDRPRRLARLHYLCNLLLMFGTCCA